LHTSFAATPHAAKDSRLNGPHSRIVLQTRARMK
jgi:hypothetical protein